jgi:hypothetical protein
MKDSDSNHGALALRLVEENERQRAEIAQLKSGAVNRNFVQVSRDYLDALDALMVQSPSARRLLTVLIKEMRRDNSLVISQEGLQKRTGFSPSTISRGVKLLRNQNWIDVKKVATMNVYFVNSAVVWTTRAEGKYASFNARVVLDWDEQDAITKSDKTPELRQVQVLQDYEEVLVTGAALGSDDPPEQAQIDFHKG